MFYSDLANFCAGVYLVLAGLDFLVDFHAALRYNREAPILPSHRSQAGTTAPSRLHMNGCH